jgi:tRNA(Ile)-lysidine synthase
MQARVAVACSGGRDSTALLHATVKAAVAQGVQVVALHINHGLSPHANAWQQSVQAQCERWARRGWPVVFFAQRLATRPARGESVEAWARQARYRALRGMAVEHGASAVLLAHHRGDQAETFVLQALRAAGVAGLSGMPKQIQRDGLVWMRPWLHVPREIIEAYVRRHRLKHVDDDSNEDVRFARNRLRLRVWPDLVAAFPQAEAALADSAAWAQEASACLAELATLDLSSIADEKGLHLDRWSVLSTARRSNALRAWLRVQTGHAAPASLVVRLMDELGSAHSAHWQVDGGALRLYRGVLRHDSSVGGADSPADCGSRLPRETVIRVRRAGVIALPGWNGRLVVSRVKQGGVALASLADAQLRARHGGEQFQAGIGRPPRSLKKQFQAAAVPAWAREGPLVYSGGQLVFAPALGVDARVLALPGQAQVTLRWQPCGGDGWPQKPPRDAS